MMRSAPDESSPTRDKGEETVANTRPRYRYLSIYISINVDISKFMYIYE